jgi:hypothetical protein
MSARMRQEEIMLRIFFIAIFLTATVGSAWGDTSLTRAEVKELKTLLSDFITALGPPPAGYSSLEEDFELPTETSRHKDSGRFYPLSPAVRLKFGTDVAAAEQSAESAGLELQKKIVEASTRGDYQAMMEYQREISALAAQMYGTQFEAKKPIDISIRVNEYRSVAIDPDGVLLEKPGVIALKEQFRAQRRTKVVIYFDPVALKKTETLSRLEFPYPEKGVATKMAIQNVVIEFEGPEAEMETWTGQINTAAVLGKIR